jgi:pimeloyl-ACP methyl ester carboxylesterase
VYAQLFARDYPWKVAGLFLCSPGPGTGKAWVEAEREVFIYNWRRSTLVEFACMAMNSVRAFFGSAVAYKRLFRQLIINYHKGYNVPPPEGEKLERINALASKKTRKEIRSYPEMANFGQTSYPVVITYGQYDAYGNSKRYITKRFPFSPVIIIPQCGHTPWKHNWPAFQPILSDFFLIKHPNGVPPPRRGV